MADDFIPPAVIDITANDTSFLATIAKDTGILSQWSSTETDTKLGADSQPFQRTLTTVKTELLDLAKQVTNARLGADATPFWAEIAALRAEVDAMSPLDINVDANISSALAKIDALKGAAASSQVGSIIDSALAGAVAGGGGKGGGGAGLMAALGFGGLFGLAGFGTLGSLAGFGAESLLTTGAGILGSAAGGLVGGAALGLGSLGVAGVGMGTDMTGLGQAAGDARQYTQALDNLNKAIAEYGAGSTQAVHAQNLLNYTLQGFPAAAQPAIVALSQTTQQFHQMFNQATGQAEAKGAAIIQQLVQVGEKFLPTIGAFASQNMTIIQSSLQPLFTWIQGPGLTIFRQLEQTFQSQLPTAMTAFTQGVELVIRVLGFLAPYTGRLITDLAKWMTELNGADFGKLTSAISTAIGIFRDWEGLIKAVGTAIYLLFHNDAGTGTSLVVTLTNMVNRFNDWARTTAGGDSLHSLLESHKNELLAIVQLIGNLIGAWGQVELNVRPIIMDLVGWIASFLNFLLQIPGVGKIMAFVLAFEILGSHIGVLGGLLGSFNNGLKNLAGAGLRIVGEALIGLGGPFATVGTWLTGLTATGETEIGTLTASIDSLNASIAAMGPTAAGAAAEFNAAVGSMDATAAGSKVLLGANGLPIAAGAAGAGTGVAEGAGAAAGLGAAATGLVVTLAAGSVAVLVTGIAGLIASARQPGPTTPQMATARENANPQNVIGMGGLVTNNQTIVQANQVMGNLAKAIETAYGAMAVAAAETPVFSTNIAELSRATGLSQTNVMALANELKINLSSALSPGQIETFTNSVKNAGGATAVTAQLAQASSLQVQAALAEMSSKATQAMPNIPAAVRNAIVATQPPLLSLVQDLNKTGDNAAGGFVTAFLAHLSPAQLASSKMHDGVQSPLFPLEEELRGIGDKSAANMVAAFIAQQPSARNASVTLHDSLKNPLYSLETELASTGNIAAADLIAEFMKHNPDAATQAGVMHDAITGKLAPLETALGSIGQAGVANLVAALGAQTNSATTAASALGAAISQGLASGITVSQGVAINAIQGVVQSVIMAGKGAAKAASPSMRAHDEIGIPIAQGIALGMVNGTSLVAAAAHSLVGSAFPKVGGSGGGAAGRNLTVSPTYHVTINAGGANPQQISSSFKKAAQEHTDDLIRRLRAGTLSSSGG